MFETREDIESSDDAGRWNRRTVLKGVATGLLGTAATGTASAQENTIILEAAARPVEYRIEVSGQISKGHEAGVNDYVTDDGATAVGVLEATDAFDDWVDEYEFTGEITDFEVTTGSLKNVWVNGRRVDPERLGGPSVTVVEDFESGEWPGEWTDQTHQYRLTENAIRGSFSLEATADWPNVVEPTVETPRGHSYAVRTVVAGGGRAEAWLLTNVQNLDVAVDDCYVARLDPHENGLHVSKEVGGNHDILASADLDLSYDTEYRLVCDVDAERLRARVLDADGTELAATDWVTDTTYAGGHPGLYTGGVGAAGTRYDDLTKHPLGEV